jgi:hypothetical protein
MTHLSMKTTFAIGSTVGIVASSVDGDKCARMCDASPEEKQRVRTVALRI